MTGPRVRLLRTVVLSAALAGSGCLYVHVERGGARPHAVQFSTLAPGSLSKTVGTDFLTSWQAAQAAVRELNMTVVAESRTTDNGSIECVTQSNERVRIEMDGRSGPQTAVKVSWTTLDDRTAGKQVLDRVNTRIAATASPAGTPVSIVPAVATQPATP